MLETARMLPKNDLSRSLSGGRTSSARAYLQAKWSDLARRPSHLHDFEREIVQIKGLISVQVVMPV